jgi:hypothetical protein
MGILSSLPICKFVGLSPKQMVIPLPLLVIVNDLVPFSALIEPKVSIVEANRNEP